MVLSTQSNGSKTRQAGLWIVGYACYDGEYGIPTPSRIMLAFANILLERKRP